VGERRRLFIAFGDVHMLSKFGTTFKLMLEIVLLFLTIISQSVPFFFPSLQEPEDAELRACRQAMAIAKQLKLQRVVLETDSMAMVSKLTAIEAPEGCHFFPPCRNMFFHSPTFF
jgi:hypothetical protein